MSSLCRIDAPHDGWWRLQALLAPPLMLVACLLLCDGLTSLTDDKRVPLRTHPATAESWAACTLP